MGAWGHVGAAQTLPCVRSARDLPGLVPRAAVVDAKLVQTDVFEARCGCSAGGNGEHNSRPSCALGPAASVSAAERHRAERDVED